MSGHSCYTGLVDKINDNNNSINIHNVPVVKATKETLEGYGEIVIDFEKSNVINNTWPKTEGRPLYQNTGNQALPTSGLFKFTYDDKFYYACNESVPDGDYVTGIIKKDKRFLIYTHEANYHPDGGQIICPIEKTPYILLLSKAGDDITPKDFIAFYCDGTFGIQILPYVWHQPAYPLVQETSFLNKQCSVHGCVVVNTVEEFNTLLCIDVTNL